MRGLIPSRPKNHNLTIPTHHTGSFSFLVTQFQSTVFLYLRG